MMDIHTHTPCAGSVYNLTLEELRAETYPDALQLLSAGLHPWWVGEKWREDFRQVERWSAAPQVKWIGETGLDKLKGAPLALQEEAFLAHIRLAEEVEKPLLIHCVKAVDELLALRKRLRPRQTWIFHGFRGKPQQMRQLLDAGFHLSFGARFNPESLEACPPALRHAETDDSGLSLSEVLGLQKLR